MTDVQRVTNSPLTALIAPELRQALAARDSLTSRGLFGVTAFRNMISAVTDVASFNNPITVPIVRENQGVEGYTFPFEQGTLGTPPTIDRAELRFTKQIQRVSSTLNIDQLSVTGATAATDVLVRQVAEGIFGVAEAALRRVLKRMTTQAPTILGDVTGGTVNQAFDSRTRTAVIGQLILHKQNNRIGTDGIVVADPGSATNAQLLDAYSNANLVGDSTFIRDGDVQGVPRDGFLFYPDNRTYTHTATAITGVTTVGMANSGATSVALVGSSAVTLNDGDVLVIDGNLYGVTVVEPATGAVGGTITVPTSGSVTVNLTGRLRTDVAAGGAVSRLTTHQNSLVLFPGAISPVLIGTQPVSNPGLIEFGTPTVEDVNTFYADALSQYGFPVQHRAKSTARGAIIDFLVNADAVVVYPERVVRVVTPV